MNGSNSCNDILHSSEIKCQSKVIPLLKEDDCSIQYGSLEGDTPQIDNDRNVRKNSAELYKVLCRLTIEPAVFSYMFAYCMNLACLSNMMIDKSCLYHFNYSSEVCKNLSQPEYQDEKNKVEISATDFSLYLSCMNLIGAFCMTFIAPWSDKYSRKIPLLFALLGASATDIGYTMCAIHFELRNEYLLWSKLPSEISGGFICVLTIFYSHASEVSTKQYRTVKYALVETAFGLGICLGGLAGGIIYKYYGYATVYETAAGFHGFCFLWVIFIVQETAGLDANVGWCEKVKDFFVCQNVKKGIKAAFRRREGYQRTLILLLMASMCVIVLTYESSSNFSFIYVYHIYNWDPTTYSYVSTIFSLAQLPLVLILVPMLIRLYKTDDFTFGVIGSISMIMKNLLISFAKYYTFIYYLGNMVGVLNGLTTMAIRSAISKLVEKDELGRVFSFLATGEAVFPICGSIILTKIFTASLNTTPNMAYLTAVISLLLPLSTFIWAAKRNRNSYQSLPTDDPVVEKI